MDFKIGSFNDVYMYVIFFSNFLYKTKKYMLWYSLELPRRVHKTYVVGTHLNCLDLSRQNKWVPTTYTFIKKQIMYMAVI